MVFLRGMLGLIWIVKSIFFFVIRRLGRFVFFEFFLGYRFIEFMLWIVIDRGELVDGVVWGLLMF